MSFHLQLYPVGQTFPCDDEAHARRAFAALPRRERGSVSWEAEILDEEGDIIDGKPIGNMEGVDLVERAIRDTKGAA